MAELGSSSLPSVLLSTATPTFVAPVILADNFTSAASSEISSSFIPTSTASSMSFSSISTDSSSTFSIPPAPTPITPSDVPPSTLPSSTPSSLTTPSVTPPIISSATPPVPTTPATDTTTPSSIIVTTTTAPSTTPSSSSALAPPITQSPSTTFEVPTTTSSSAVVNPTTTTTSAAVSATTNSAPQASGTPGALTLPPGFETTSIPSAGAPIPSTVVVTASTNGNGQFQVQGPPETTLSNVVVGGSQTLSVGAPAITVQGFTISAASNAQSVVVNSKTIPLTELPAIVPGLIATPKATVITPGASTAKIPLAMSDTQLSTKLESSPIPTTSSTLKSSFKSTTSTSSAGIGAPVQTGSPNSPASSTGSAASLGVDKMAILFGILTGGVSIAAFAL